MKYCLVDGTRYPDASIRCRVCGAELAHDFEVDESLHISTLCCPEKGCEELVAEPGYKYCRRCGTKLQPISEEIWVEKVVAPAFDENPRQVLLSPDAVFALASQMGLDKNEARIRLDRFISALAGVNRSQIDQWVLEALDVLATREPDVENLRRQVRRLAADRKISRTFASKIADEFLKPSVAASVPVHSSTNEASASKPTGDSDPEGSIPTTVFPKKPVGSADSPIETKEMQNDPTSFADAEPNAEPYRVNGDKGGKRDESGKPEGPTESERSSREEDKGDFTQSDSAQASSQEEPKGGHKKNWRPKFFVSTAVVLGAGLLWLFGPSLRRTRQVRELTPTSPIQSGTPLPSPSVSPVPNGMALISGGDFYMGSERGKDFEAPPHQVTVKSFYIDQYEVTHEQYQQCVSDKRSCEPPSDWVDNRHPVGAERLPITGVKFRGADKYCAWAGKRLPTESEWEYAARGSDARRVYPWGERWLPERANFDNKELREVGSYKPQTEVNGIKLYDLLGNAWEWTSSLYEDYPGTRNPRKQYIGGDVRMVRGGGYKNKPLTATHRDALPIDDDKQSYKETGFRCAKDVSP